MSTHRSKTRLSFQRLFLRLAASAIVAFPLATLAAPVVLYTDIISGPNNGGEGGNGAYLSIFGKGFGTNLANVKVFVGGGEVTRYMYLGPSYGRPDMQQLSVQLGAATSTGPIKVTVGGLDSNTDKIFTVRPGRFFFVSLSGSDSNGVMNDITRPFRTPNFLKSRITPGDFIVVRGGTYNFDDGTHGIYNNTWLRYPPNGTATSPNTFMGYPGETVSVVLNNPVKLVALNGDAGSHWVVSNFAISLNNCQSGDVLALSTITTTSSLCLGNVRNKLTDVRVVNLDLDGHDVGGKCAGGGDSPIDIQFSDHIKILGVSIHNTGTSDPSNASHVIYLSTAQNNTEVGWNSLHHIPYTRAIIQVHQDEFDGSCYVGKQLTDIQIHDNIIHDMGGQAILLDGGTGDIQVYNNVIYNSLLTTYSDVIALRGSGGHLNAFLYNNTVYDNADIRGPGYMLGIGSPSGGWFPQKVTLYNNIFHLTDPTDAYFGTDGSAGALQTWLQAGNMTSNNNLWFGSSGPAPSFKGPNEVNADPLFVNPSFADFHLLNTSGSVSPAIDKGTSLTNTLVTRDFDGNVRAQGSAPDIGAFESIGLTLPAPQNVRIIKN